MRSTPRFDSFDLGFLAVALVLVVLVAGCDAPASVDTGTAGVDSGPVSAVETGRLVGMTAAHNRWRASIGASPAIPPVTWSPDLAAIAQAYSETLASTGCTLAHSRNEYGENLAWFSGIRASPDDVVDGWASEQSCYTFGAFMRGDVCTSACDRSGGCGHYTQVVWRDTTRIGCGVATCPGGAEIWTCNYDPPGNFIGREPY